MDTKFKITTFAILFLILIIDTMNLGLVFPLFGPLFASKASTMLSANTSDLVRDLWYGLAVAIFNIFMFFGAPFLGDLSDHIGRRKVLLICLFGTAISVLISAWGVMINSLFLFIGGRALAGFVSGSQSLAQAAIVDMSAPARKAINLSLITLSTCIGFTLGPLLGSVLTKTQFVSRFGFTLPFLVAALLAFVNAVCLMMTFKETFYPGLVQRLRLSRGIEIFISAFTNQSIRVLSLLYLMAEFSWALYFQSLPLFLVRKYAYNSTEIGHLLTVMGILLGLSLLVVMKLLTRYLAVAQIVYYSFGLTALGCLLTMIKGEWWVWFGAVPATVGGTLFYVGLLTLFSDAAGIEAQGWAMGVFAAIAAFAWGIGGVITGTLNSIGIYVPYIIASILMIVGMIGFKIESGATAKT